MGNNGKQLYSTKFYNLDAILSVGYRVNSKTELRATRTRIHDRFLIIDDQVYHLGASLKDLGRKLFAFSKMGLDKALLMGQVL